MNVGHVQNGTHAGWRIVKPAPKPWHCNCLDGDGLAGIFKLQPAYMSRCADCKQERP